MKKISIRPEREYLREIVNKMQDGQYAVPAFQRDLVWDTSQIIDLFDSISKGYPIGSAILWRPRPTDTYPIKTIYDKIEISAKEAQYYILDGRQRLTTFYCCVIDYEGKPSKFKLCYNLEKDSFEFPKKNSDSMKLVLLSDVYDTFSMLGILQKYMNIEDVSVRNDYIVKIKKLNTILQSYEIGEVILDDCSLDEASTVFSRINSKGTDISKVEMLQALYYNNKRSVLVAEEIKELINEMKSYDFSGLRTDDVLNCCYRYLGKFNFENKIKELLEHGSLEEIVEHLKVDFKKAVEFLHCECGVLSYKHLPYARQLVAICAFFAVKKDYTTFDLKELKKWFFYTSAQQSFQNSSLGNIRPIFYRFDEFLKNEKNTACDYEDVVIDNDFDFTYANKNAQSNLIAMCLMQELKRKGQDNIRYIGDYTSLNKKPAFTFIMLYPDDRQKLNNIFKHGRYQGNLEHLLLNDEMVDCILNKQYGRFEKLRKEVISKVVIDNLMHLEINVVIASDETKNESSIIMLSQKSKEKLRLWLSLWPESTHPEDEKRKTDFIKCLRVNHETVGFEDLYNCYRELKPEIDEEVAKVRCQEWIKEVEKELQNFI